MKDIRQRYHDHTSYNSTNQDIRNKSKERANKRLRIFEITCIISLGIIFSNNYNNINLNNKKSINPHNYETQTLSPKQNLAQYCLNNIEQPLTLECKDFIKKSLENHL
jgi:hypothetical protein